MPYLITTTTDRWAVDTLARARQDARNIIEDGAQQGWTAEYTAARDLARQLPESGGTIALPNGQSIEVKEIAQILDTIADHESMRLFQPAPTQLPGQLGF